ncbi:hypothetical protein BDF20DRAFT_816780, partial [Mycotypha africana]|uniref:uncharacterized protein n=1 Tax=Mycotypha africana TaxID=64632 RepID=UPI0022FFF028
GMSVHETVSPKPMEHIFDWGGFIVEVIATRGKYLKKATFDESSSACPKPIEKPKEDDVLYQNCNNPQKRIFCLA